MRLGGVDRIQQYALQRRDALNQGKDFRPRPAVAGPHVTFDDPDGQRFDVQGRVDTVRVPCPPLSEILADFVEEVLLVVTDIDPPDFGAQIENGRAGGETALGAAGAGGGKDMAGRDALAPAILLQFFAGGDVTPQAVAVTGANGNGIGPMTPVRVLRLQLGEDVITATVVFTVAIKADGRAGQVIQ